MTRYVRRIIRVTALDSPNVKLGLRQKALGLPDTGTMPDGKLVVPGVLPYAEYKKRLKLWDKVRQTIGLWGEFYEGAEFLLFPPDWLVGAEVRADKVRRCHRDSERKCIGVDPAEGGDKSAWTVGDRFGFIEQISMPTPNTRVVPRETKALMHRYNVRPEDVLFDAGGGGKVHADYLRDEGLNVRTVPFGSPVTPPVKVGTQFPREKAEHRETRYVYMNIRAMMYGELSEAIDPERGDNVFGIPGDFAELRRQLALIPKTYDDQGRLYILPKRRKGKNHQANQQVLEEILGCSPDEADSAVLCYHGLVHRSQKNKVGVRS